MTIMIGGQGGTSNDDTTEEVIEMGVSVPLSEFTTDGVNHRINSQNSTYEDNVTGGSIGEHTYYFSGQKNKLDVLVGSSDLPIALGANVAIVNGNYEKTISGNSWNSYIYSTQSFDPALEDFSISVEVLETTGTIRQMIGLDDNPTANASYSSIDFAVYQVNGNFYQNVYEKASSVSTGGSAVALAVGDRIGVRCESGVVTYYVQSGATITDIYTSLKKATKPMFFKAVLNRGVGSSGHSRIGNVKYHTGTVTTVESTRISGLATQSISETDKESLLVLGIEPSLNTTYSDFRFTRPINSVFPTGLTLDYTHRYSVNENQDIQSVTL